MTMIKYNKFLLEKEESSKELDTDFSGFIRKGNKERNAHLDQYQRFIKNSRNVNFLDSIPGSDKVDGRPDTDEVIGDNDDKKKLLLNFNKFEKFLKFKEKSEYLRKEPKYINQFFFFQEKEGKTDQELEDLYKEIIIHKNTLKQQRVDVTILDTFEKVHDELSRMELIEKTNKFVKLLPNKDGLRTKIKGNADWMKHFSDLLIGYSYEDYKNTFLRKVAKYHTPQDFFDALENHISSFAPKSDLFKNLENHPGSEVVMSSDDFLIGRIYSKKASCDLGSQQWCIAGKHGSYWHQYVVGGGYNDSDKFPGVQYIVWDFRYKATKQEFQTGVTMYRKGSSGYGGKYVAHLKNDSSTGIEGKDWEKYLIGFDELSLTQKVRLIAENPDIEKSVKIINGLDETHKRKLLEEIPVLLKHFDDLTFLSNAEIWTLVKKDISLTEFLPVALQLTEDQRLISIIKNPNLLDIKFIDGEGEKKSKKSMDNPYTGVTHLLTRSQKIEMISNKHSLYTSFELSDDEHFELINRDVNILISFPDIVKQVDQLKLKQMYIDNKSKWDSEMNKSNDDAKHRVALLLTHLTKPTDRLNMESSSNCYIFIGKEIDGRIIPENEYGLIQIDNVLEPENERIAIPLLMVGFSDELKGYSAWVSKNLIDKSELVEYMYKFKEDPEKLAKGEGSEKEVAIINSIQIDSNPPSKIIKR